MDDLTHGAPARPGEPRARLRVAPDPGAGELVVHLAGDLDLVGVTDLAGSLEELLNLPPQPLLLDLADVAFLDSSGLTVLIRIANRFGRVRARSAAQPVRRVIEVLGLADTLGLDGA